MRPAPRQLEAAMTLLVEVVILLCLIAVLGKLRRLP
jgi:hypothetical protein